MSVQTESLPGVIENPAAWYGRDLQDDDSWVELLSTDEISEILTAVAQVN